MRPERTRLRLNEECLSYVAQWTSDFDEYDGVFAEPVGTNGVLWVGMQETV